MAAALRPVGHEDRLSLVEHLTELRGRIVICLVAFAATTALCIWQNQRVLDILNKPLAENTTSASNHDPIQQGAGYDQLIARWMKDDAALNRRTAAAIDDPQLRAEVLAHARQSE